MTERTFSIIKPDAVKRNLIGAILGRFESQGFRVVALKMVQLTKEQAEGFYADGGFCVGKRKCRERLPHFNRGNESG